jgi:hypothetical protein
MAVDWASLTADQVQSLVSSPMREVRAGLDLLDFDLTFAEDISDSLLLNGAQVQWNGYATVHRGCSLSLTRSIDWAHQLIRPWMTLTDNVTGLSAKRYVGVFTLAKPTKPLGSSPVVYQVTGQDRMALLTTGVGYSYVVSAGMGVLDAVRQVFTDAGLTGVLIDGTASAAIVPVDMVWPWIPVTDPAGTTGEQPARPDDGGSGDTADVLSWLRIVNDLLNLVAYRGVWCDEAGFFRCVPYINPSDRSESFTFTKASPLGLSRELSIPLPQFNAWTFVNSTLPDVDGVPAVPTEGDGIYTVPNDTGERDQPTLVTFAAADQPTLVALGDARVAADRRVTTTATVETGPFPQASHFDVFTWIDSDLDEGAWKVEATAWEMPLNGDQMRWSWTKVA